MELGLIENLQREDLNPMEEAAGYRTLIQEYGLTQEETAQRVGKSRPAVANALRLLALPEEIGAMLEEGLLSAGHARALLPLPNGALQLAAAKKILDEGLTVRQTEALVKRLQRPQQEAPVEDTSYRQFSLYLKEAEKGLSEHYGRKVKIHHGKKKGKIELEYYDQTDLEHLLNILDSAQHGKGSMP
jgi:ParB family chromosome partitioning protein